MLQVLGKSHQRHFKVLIVTTSLSGTLHINVHVEDRMTSCWLGVEKDFASFSYMYNACSTISYNVKGQAQHVAGSVQLFHPDMHEISAIRH